MKTGKQVLVMLLIVALSIVGVFLVQANDAVDSPFLIEFLTDKGSYKATDMARISIKVTNISEKCIENVSAEALFDGLSPVGKSNTLKAESNELNPGDSLSFNYSAMINSNHGGLSIFQKIILFFKHIFNRVVSVSDNGFNDGRAFAEESQTITFGKMETVNTIRVWYTKNTGTSPITTSNDYEELIRGVDIDEIYDDDLVRFSFDDQTSVGYVNNIITIMFEEEINDNERAEIINSLNGKVVGGNKLYDELYIQIQPSSRDTLDKICAQINERKSVFAYYSNVYDNLKNAIPNDPFADDDEQKQETRMVFWNGLPCNRNWGQVAIDAEECWNYDQYYHDDQYFKNNIGVVDEGFDTAHPDLDITVISNDNSVEDHGTHVAGIIGAKANNSRGIAGIVWKNRLFGYDAKRFYSSDNREHYTDDEIYLGLSKLVQAGCKVINFSLGESENLPDSNHSKLLIVINQEALIASMKVYKLLKNNYDFVVVQSAGNGATNPQYSGPQDTEKLGVDAINNGLFSAITKENCFQNYLISADDILDRIIIVTSAVRSSSDDGKYMVSAFGNGGDQVDVAAPGEQIYSTISENRYDTKAGTSEAAPFVSAVANLVWSVNPSFSGADIKRIIKKTAKAGGIEVLDNPSSPTTKDYYMVNANLAVKQAIKETYKTGTVTGKVVDIIPDEPKPLSNIRIIATNKTTNKVIYGTTENDGTFSLLLPAGTYDIKFSKGVAELLAEDVIVSDNSSTNLGTLNMMIPESIVSGIVIDKFTKEPIDGVRVKVIDNYLPVGDSQVVEKVTDQDGRFQIRISMSDDCTLCFEKEMYGFYETSKDISASQIDLGKIQLSPAGTSDAIAAGSCGISALWKITKDGLLTISGEGAISDFTSKGPWQSYLDKILSVTIGSEISRIGTNAFKGCINLSEVQLSDGLLEIGNKAFSECKQLNEIIIPKTVTKIENYAFEECTGLTNIDYYPISLNMTEDNYSLFKNAGTDGDGIDVIIGNTVETIPENLFWSYAKSGYKPDASPKIKTVQIGENVKSIGKGAFARCDNLTSVSFAGQKVALIDEEAFAGCSSLKSVTLPESVEQMGRAAFMGCSLLEQAIINGTNLEIPEYAFYQCPTLINITINNGIRSIGRSAFYGSNIVRVAFPNSLEEIGESAFCGCNNLKTISFSVGVKTIGKDAFYGCTNLQDFALPEHLTTIGDSAFNNCKSITGVAIPDSVKTIEKFAFWNCDALKTFTLGRSVEVVDENIVLTSALDRFLVPNTITWLQSADNMRKMKGYLKEKFVFVDDTNQPTTEIILTPSVKEIPEKAFGEYKYNDITKVTINSGVLTIGKQSFEGCENLEYVVLPNTVTSICDFAFYSCFALKCIVLPQSVNEIGTCAFYSNKYFCDGYTLITIENTNCVIADSNDTLGYNAVIQGHKGSTAEAYSNQYHREFWLISEASDVIIAAGTCGADSSWYLYSNGCLKIIGSGEVKLSPDTQKAPWHIYNELITEGVFEGISTMPRESFSGCSNLQKVVICDTITRIPAQTFYNCTGLKEILLPKTVIEIANGAFYGCNSLETVFYTGSEAEWSLITIGSSGNKCLNNATILYNWSN